MSEVTCPYCYATLFDSELSAAECTSCMRRLPVKWLQATARGADKTGPIESGMGWESVRNGAALMAVAAFIAAGALPLAALAIFLGTMTREYRSEMVVLMLAGLVLLVAAGLGLAGLICTLIPPPRAGLRGRVFGIIACLVIGVLAMLFPSPLDNMARSGWVFLGIAIPKPDDPPGWLAVALVGIVKYFSHLGHVARLFGDASLAGLLLTCGIVAALVTVLNVIGLVVFEFFHLPMARHEQEVLLFGGVAAQGIALMLWLGFLLWKVRGCIAAAPR